MRVPSWLNEQCWFLSQQWACHKCILALIIFCKKLFIDHICILQLFTVMLANVIRKLELEWWQLTNHRPSISQFAHLYLYPQSGKKCLSVRDQKIEIKSVCENIMCQLSQNTMRSWMCKRFPFFFWRFWA